MKLEDCIYKSLIEYPALYLCNNYEDSKMLVLNHLFLVNGNGMDWAISKDGKQEGYLIESKYKGTRDKWIRLPDKPYGKPVIKNKLPFVEIIEKYKKEYLEESRYESVRDFHNQLPKRIQKLIRDENIKDLENGNYLQKFDEHSPYPYSSKYWPFAEIHPRLIQPDWKAGMIQCFKWASEYYETTKDDTNGINGINHDEKLVRIRELGNAIHILESFK